jgi:hypothetical protein
MVEEDVDTVGDGKPHEWRVYVEGKLSRIKRDTNEDGKPDVWEIFTNGRLERMGIDNSGDGHVDVWLRDDQYRKQMEDEDDRARAAKTDGGAPKSGDAGAAAAADGGAVGDGGAADDGGDNTPKARRREPR